MASLHGGIRFGISWGIVPSAHVLPEEIVFSLCILLKPNPRKEVGLGTNQKVHVVPK